MTSRGMSAGPVAPDRLVLPVTATAGALDSMFHTRISKVMGTGSAGWYANSKAATVPRALAPLVVTVVGLTNVNASQPNLAVSQAGKVLGSGGAGAITKPVLAVPSPTTVARGTNCPVLHGSPTPALAAYGVSPLYRSGDSGSGVTIGLIELSGYRPSDIAAFENACRLTTRVYSATGSAGTPSLETTADIEVAAAASPGAAIAVYQGSSPWALWSSAINADVAKVISSSWTTCEPYAGSAMVKAESMLFAQAAAQGQSVLAASGDWGSSGCHYSGNNVAAVEDPAGQPLVTGVGGTSLVFGVGQSNKLVAAQAAWADSGGGPSENWARPPWQPAVPKASSPAREVPDVAASANKAGASYYAYCNTPCGSGWERVGGTSMAAPLWAGMISLAEQNCGAPLGMLGPALYSKAAAAGLERVYGGSNNGFGPGYSALGQYNMATGLGSPDMALLAPVLCRQAATGN